MSDRRFWDVAAIDFPIVDADAHVNEPPDLWETRLPARWRERGPRVQRRADGDVWLFDGGRATRALGLTASAGLSDLEIRPAGHRYEDVRPASWDPKARLRELDLDGIHTQVLYPSITLTGASTYSDDPDLQQACVRAYNEWLAEFCAGGEGRLVGMAVLPATGVEAAIAELECALEHGHRGVLLSAFPSGGIDPHPDDDQFWAAVATTGVPVAVHIGSFSRMQPNPVAKSRDNLPFLAGVAASHAGSETVPLVADLLFSGVFERFPALRLLLVESNIGWIPTALEQTDDMFFRYRWFTGAADSMVMLPSQLFHRNVWATFMTDAIGLELRHHLNLDHVMWSTDYPHSVTSWPNSRALIQQQFRGLPAAEVRKMLRDNVVALYDLDVPERLVEAPAAWPRDDDEPADAEREG
jgi:predicted TIM-barrel fold metal-dependent hydrolase